MNRQIPILRQTRLDIIRSQIDAVQSIAMPLGAWLLGAYQHNNPGDADAFKHNPIAGEGIVAAETTFILACEKLGDILRDPKLLSLEDQETTEKATREMLEENTKFIAVSKAAIEWNNSPAARFEPVLVRLNDLGWAAVFGDMANDRDMICGIGKSPESALTHFNKVFAGEAPEPVVLYALAREKALEINRDTAPPAVFDSNPLNQNPDKS